MFEINCSVDNCAHNKQGTCFANKVNIGGANATCDCDTCCSAFLDVKNYGVLTSNTNGSACCDALICKVSNCIHNENTLCNLSSINVAGDDVKVYTETSCKSFE